MTPLSEVEHKVYNDKLRHHVSKELAAQVWASFKSMSRSPITIGSWPQKRGFGNLAGVARAGEAGK